MDSIFDSLEGEVIEAINAGDSNTLKAILTHNTVDLNSTKLFEQLPLHAAIASGNLSSVEVLLEQGAKTDINDRNGQTPLHAAARENNLQIISCLLDLGADINAQDAEGATPLHVAAGGDSVAAIKHLLTQGANINAQDVYGQTPLHVAGGRDSVAAINTLLDLGADINAKGAEGATLLHVAASRNSVAAINTLLDLGANISAKDNKNNTPLDWAMSGLTQPDVILALLEKSSQTAKYDFFKENITKKGVIFFVRLLAAGFDTQPDKPNGQGYEDYIEKLLADSKLYTEELAAYLTLLETARATFAKEVQEAAEKEPTNSYHMSARDVPSFLRILKPGLKACDPTQALTQKEDQKQISPWQWVENIGNDTFQEKKNALIGKGCITYGKGSIEFFHQCLEKLPLEIKHQISEYLPFAKPVYRVMAYYPLAPFKIEKFLSYIEQNYTKFQALDHKYDLEFYSFLETLITAASSSPALESVSTHLEGLAATLRPSR